MLPSKLRDRSSSGPITPLSTRPAYVRNSRLAFNLQGFPPFEPRMAGWEDRDDECEGSECHGALVELSREDYERVWLSEGGGTDNPSYEEFVVDAIPYGDGGEPVKAIALRVRDGKRVPDGPPSKRYMEMLISGAKEIQLTDVYVKKLEAVKTESPSRILKFVGYYNFFLTSVLWRMRTTGRLKGFSNVNMKVTNALFFGRSNQALKFLSDVSLLLWMLPGSVIGAMIRLTMFVRGVEVSPMIKAVFADDKK